MNFLEGFNSVSNSGPTQAQRGMGAQKGMMGQMGGVPGQLGMIGQGGQGMPSQQGYNADWSGAPYGFNAQPWNTQPWTNPWASPQVGQQPMQQPPQQTMQQSAQQQYLPAGVSPDIPGFDPKVPGGGMHQQQLGGNAPAPAAPFAPAAPQRYEMVKNPWTGKATSDNAGFDPMEGYSIQPVVRNPNSRINYNSPIYQQMMASNRQ